MGFRPSPARALFPAQKKIWETSAAEFDFSPNLDENDFCPFVGRAGAEDKTVLSLTPNVSGGLNLHTSVSSNRAKKHIIRAKTKPTTQALKQSHVHYQVGGLSELVTTIDGIATGQRAFGKHHL